MKRPAALEVEHLDQANVAKFARLNVVASSEIVRCATILGADLHDAPITFVMHRNGIQLSGTNKQVMDKDPRPIIESQGITIIELDSFADTHAMYKAYHDAWNLAQQGRPSMLYPTGDKSTDTERVDLNDLGRRYTIAAENAAFAAKNPVAMETESRTSGALKN